MTHDQIVDMCNTYRYAILGDTGTTAKWAADRKFLWKRVLVDGQPRIILWDHRRDRYTGKVLDQSPRKFEEYVSSKNAVIRTGDPGVTFADNTAGPAGFAMLRNEVY